MHCRHSDGGGEIVGRVGRGRVDEEREGFERVQVVVEGVRHGGEEGTLIHSVGSREVVARDSVVREAMYVLES